jgi:hypothetical protein
MLLETILAELQQIRGLLQTQATAAPATTYVAPPAQPPAQLQAAPLAPAAPAGVTADAITALIQPHISNEAIKAALGAAMRGMGINALPETQPHQFGQLYAAFQQVIAQHTGAGAAPPAASASII